ncbi:MAG: motility associated factor glycosyltransferase family protein [Lachnospiraceae bacterium]|nr:motility associated factor glycosyltransferase family protein [Lachnospiraceae bacterium]
MSTVYETNYKAMKERYPGITEYLDRYSEEAVPAEEDDIEVGVQDVCGKSVMCVQKGGHTYQLDSLYDSDVLLDLWFASLGDEWAFESKLLMYGFGNGMYVRKFLKSARSDCTIVVHEPSVKMLKTVMENYDISDMITDSRVRIVFWPVYKGSEEIKTFYDQLISYRDLASQKIAFYANYPRIFEKDCSDYLAGIRSAREFTKANQIVHDRFGDDYNRNTFNNMKYIPDSLSYRDLIRKMPEDIPAVIVAAGPSLDKNITDLKAAKGKCIMISTDTALKPLALAGIEPDLAVITDGKKDAKYMSEELSRYVPLFCTPRSGYQFMELHKGKKFFTDYYCEHIKHFMDAEGCMFIPLPTGGSVANSCFGLAESLHCRRIILVGQDLAYTGDRTHSAFTVRGGKKTAVDDLEHVIMGTDINGKPVRTSSEFKMYKEWFEDEIKTHPDVRVIDATEGGIRIEGTVLMTLKDAIEKECNREFDFAHVLANVGRLLDEEKSERFCEYIGKIPEQLNELKRLVNHALEDYSGMKELVEADNYHTPLMITLYKRTCDAGKEIEISPIIEYVHNQLQGRSTELLDKVNKLEKDEKQELLTVCDLGMGYLRDMKQAITELEPYMEILKRDFTIY